MLHRLHFELDACHGTLWLVGLLQQLFAVREDPGFAVCSFHRDTPGLPRGKATKHALEEAHHDALRELVWIHASLLEVTEELGLGRERLERGVPW